MRWFWLLLVACYDNSGGPPPAALHGRSVILEQPESVVDLCAACASQLRDGERVVRCERTGDDLYFYSVGPNATNNTGTVFVYCGIER